jgi:hypothetical protein
MRLLNANTFTLLILINEDTVPDYAILSHTWGDDEVTFRDLTELSREQLVSKRAWEKVEKCCTKAMEWGLKWVWIDTCCIDKSSSAELSEAINSMYQWYRKSAVCYAYLSDVDSVEEDFLSDRVIDQGHSSFDKARWFIEDGACRSYLPREICNSTTCAGSTSEVNTA